MYTKYHVLEIYRRHVYCKQNMAIDKLYDAAPGLEDDYH